MEGRVLGMFFGAQVDHPDTGFALAEAQLAPHLAMTGNTRAGADRRLRQLSRTTRPIVTAASRNRSGLCAA